MTRQKSEVIIFLSLTLSIVFFFLSCGNESKIGKRDDTASDSDTDSDTDGDSDTDTSDEEQYKKAVIVEPRESERICGTSVTFEWEPGLGTIPVSQYELKVDSTNDGTPDVFSADNIPSTQTSQEVDIPGSIHEVYISLVTRFSNDVEKTDSKYFRVGHGPHCANEWDNIYDPGSGPTFWGLASSGSMFVAVGDPNFTVVDTEIIKTSRLIWKSSDGIDWLPVNPTVGAHRTMMDVTWDAQFERFVTIGSNGDTLHSSNGSDWTAGTTGTTQDLFNVAYGDGVLIAGGMNSTVLKSTDGGANWEPAGNTIAGHPRWVGFGNGRFLISNGSTIFSSDDCGDTWVNQEYISGGSILSFAHGDAGWVAGGRITLADSSTRFAVWHSPSGDSDTWDLVFEEIYAIGSGYIQEIEYTGKIYIGTGTKGIVITSENGVDWTLQRTPVGTQKSTFGIAYMKDTVVLAGNKIKLEKSSCSKRSPLATLDSPLDRQEISATSVDLSVLMTDGDGDQMNVKFWGRDAGAATDDLTIVVLPDSQWYPTERPEVLDAQTQWALDNNAAFLAHVGDITEYHNEVPEEWIEVDEAISIIELGDIPYVLAIGNHDQTTPGNPLIPSTSGYNDHFSADRFDGVDWYGGHWEHIGDTIGNNNDSNYVTFSVGGIDFIAISLEYDPQNQLNEEHITWASEILEQNEERRAIIVTHDLLDHDGDQFSPAGTRVFNMAKEHSNVFLMLAGHREYQVTRSDLGTNGNTIYTMVVCYHKNFYDGHGFMRILEFKPKFNYIYAQTYSPLGTDADEYEYRVEKWNEFKIDYDMGGTDIPKDFELIGEASDVLNNTIATITWENLEPERVYEWYVVADDGIATTVSPLFRFTTE